MFLSVVIAPSQAERSGKKAFLHVIPNSTSGDVPEISEVPYGIADSVSHHANIDSYCRIVNCRYLFSGLARVLAAQLSSPPVESDIQGQIEMKKIAIGCGIVVLLLAVAAAVGSYLVYRKVSSAFGDFAQLASVPDIERSVRNQSAFTPSSSGELTDSQMQRFLRVQATVRSRLGQRAAEIERKYRTLLEKDKATALDFPELVSAYRDLAAGYVEAKRVQVEALNEAGFSLAEYRWIRNQAYAALGMPMMDLDVAKIIDDVRAGRTPGQPERSFPVGPTGPPVNQEVVKPHRKLLEDNAGLAFFGL